MSNPILYVLTGWYQHWQFVTGFTVIGCSFAYFVAGLVACWSLRRPRALLWLPLLAAIVGGSVGLVTGGLSAALIAKIYDAIPYSLGTDVAACLGLAQAVLIVYFNLGRGARSLGYNR